MSMQELDTTGSIDGAAETGSSSAGSPAPGVERPYERPKLDATNPSTSTRKDTQSISATNSSERDRSLERPAPPQQVARPLSPLNENELVCPPAMGGEADKVDDALSTHSETGTLQLPGKTCSSLERSDHLAIGLSFSPQSRHPEARISSALERAVAREQLNESARPSSIARSKLAPTAPPFVYVPKHGDRRQAIVEPGVPVLLQRSVTPARWLDTVDTDFGLSSTTLVPSHQPGPMPIRAEPACSSEPGDSDDCLPFPSIGFVGQGLLGLGDVADTSQSTPIAGPQDTELSQSVHVRYNIAEEILRRQSCASVGESQSGGRFEVVRFSDAADKWSTLAPVATYSFPQVESTHELEPSSPIGQRMLSTSAFGGSHRPPPGRARSSSLGSHGLLDGSSMRQTASAVPAHDDSAAHPSVDVQTSSNLWPGTPSGWVVSQRTRALSLASSSTQEASDALYLEARNTHLRQTLTSGVAPPTLANQEAMIVHFDLAIRSDPPLAGLHGSLQAISALEARGSVSIGSGGSDVVASHSSLPFRLLEEGAPSPNNRKHSLYKTELCRSWEERGSCRYGSKCQFAHGVEELRVVARHPKFKSEVCRTFWLLGSCPYGRRCCFIHTTAPAAGVASTEEIFSPPSSTSSSGFSSTGGPGGSRKPSMQVEALQPTSSPPSQLACLDDTSRPFVPPATLGLGPALASYLGPFIASSSVDLAGNGMTPPDVRRCRAHVDIGSTEARLLGQAKKEASDSASSLRLGLKAPNPAEVPPTFQEPPRSRLHRLASFPSPSISGSRSDSQASDVDIRDSRLDLFLPTHTRHPSASSLSSISTNSSLSSLASTPFTSSRFSSLSRAKSVGSLALYEYGPSTALQKVQEGWSGERSKSLQGFSSVSALSWGYDQRENL